MTILEFTFSFHFKSNKMPVRKCDLAVPPSAFEGLQMPTLLVLPAKKLVARHRDIDQCRHDYN